MRTYDYVSDSSDCTLAESVKGYWWALPNDYVGQNIVFYFNSEPNVPNPFNPSTSIGYSLAVNSDVVLSIYNVLGRKIRTLVNEERDIGHHSSIWDGKDADNDMPKNKYLDIPEYTQFYLCLVKR